MAKWKRIVVAGSLVMEVVYPRMSPRDSQRARGVKRKLSSEAQQRMNLKYSYQKLEFALAANFGPGDLVVTLTYDDGHLPKDRKAAEARLKYFRSKLSAARKTKSRELVMFWCTEHKHGEGRWHHHCVINATGDDYELLRQLWNQGEAEIKPLRVDRERNYETQARYMTKEERERLGQRGWSYTRTAAKPEEETFRVDDDTPLQPPRGALVFAEAGERTEFGSYRFVKYLAPGYDKRRRPRARRRRRTRR